MKSTRGTAGRIFSALAHANVNVKMIDQGSSELNIIIGVENRDFENAVKAIYDIFVLHRFEIEWIVTCSAAFTYMKISHTFRTSGIHEFADVSMYHFWLSSGSFNSKRMR